MSKYFITGMPLREQFIEVEAFGILDALTKLGLTVWTEEQWKEAQDLLKANPLEQTK